MRGGGGGMTSIYYTLQHHVRDMVPWRCIIRTPLDRRRGRHSAGTPNDKLLVCHRPTPSDISRSPSQAVCPRSSYALLVLDYYLS